MVEKTRETIEVKGSEVLERVVMCDGNTHIEKDQRIILDIDGNVDFHENLSEVPKPCTC